MRISDWSSDVCSSDLGDFDGDSRADVLWRNSANGYNTIWRSASSTTGLAVTALAAPWQVAGTGDFNADGKADILWRNPTSGANVIWLGADSTKPQAATTVSGAGGTVAGIADFTGDARADILWRHTVTGSTTTRRFGISATGKEGT